MSPNKSTDRVRRTMAVVHPNAAAIDVGATMHMAAVNADRTTEPVRSFGTCERLSGPAYRRRKRW
jgi:transposase